MCNVAGILVSGTCMAIPCEVGVTIGCVLANIFINVRSICTSRMRVV